MEINVFSFILIFVCIAIYSTSNNFKEKYANVLLLTVFIELLMPQGFFISIGKFIFSYQYVLGILLLFLSSIYLNKIRNKEEKYYRKCYTFLLLVFIGHMICVIIPYDGMVISHLAGWDNYVKGEESKVLASASLSGFVYNYPSLISFTLVSYILKCDFELNEIAIIFKKIKMGFMIYLSYVTFEFFAKNILASDITIQLADFIFGSGENVSNGLYERNGLILLQGVTNESSQLALSLFYFLIAYIIYENILSRHKISRRQIFVILYTIGMLWLSGAFSALIYIICFGMFFAWIKKLRKEKIKSFFDFYGILKLCFGCAVLYFLLQALYISSDFVAKRIDNINEAVDVIQNGDVMQYGLLTLALGQGSAIPRLLSVYDTFNDALNNPLWGMGLGVEQAHSGIVTGFAYMGLIGLILWWNITSYKRSKIAMIIMVIIPNLFLGYFFMSMSAIFIVVLMQSLDYSIIDRMLEKEDKNENEIQCYNSYI